MNSEIAEQFRNIKKQLGLKNDTEVIRYLIVSFHTMKEKEQKLERKLDELLEKLYDKVDRLEQDLKALEEQLKNKGEGLHKLCPKCGGRGYVLSAPDARMICPECHGTGVIET
jgi:ribosomal protein S27AE